MFRVSEIESPDILYVYGLPALGQDSLPQIRFDTQLTSLTPIIGLT